MAQIRIEWAAPPVDGAVVKFKAPCDCTEVTGILLCYPDADGTEANKSFTFRDSHGADLTGLGNLFSAGAYVMAMLDPVNGFAYLLNADNNSYIESMSGLVKVWENASPSSSFSEQTISLDLKEYTHILVDFVSTPASHIVGKGINVSVPRISVTSTSANATVIEIDRRPISFDDTSVTIGACYHSVYTTTNGKFSATDTIGTNIKPLRIFGLKGAL